MIYIGIDNGVSGGLVALSKQGCLITALPMPILKARKGNEVDPVAVWNWMDDMLITRDDAIIAIEEPGGSKSAKAATSMAGSFHALRALCALKRLRWERITPQLWQKSMLPGANAGETKPRALEAVKRLWPNETFLATERSTKPHEGLIDAALIAEYARRKNL